MNAQEKVKNPKNKSVGIIIVCAAVLIIIAVCILGFRDGGWFRGRGSAYDTENMQSLIDYAKQLEADGNSEAAAAVYELIAKNGGGELIRKANEDIPVVKADNVIEQFKRFLSGSGEGEGK